MTIASAADLCAFIDRSPTPFHVCRTVAGELDTAGYTELTERGTWPAEAGRFYVVRGGSLVAWSTESSTDPADAFRVVGGHTDSPNLRLKQHHDLSPEGLGVVALEPYGGAWLHSWFDRDLGIAGRLALRDGSHVLVHVDEPVLRVPQLAIHLSRPQAAGGRRRSATSTVSGRRRPARSWTWSPTRPGCPRPTCSASS